MKRVSMYRTISVLAILSVVLCGCSQAGQPEASGESSAQQSSAESDESMSLEPTASPEPTVQPEPSEEPTPEPLYYTMGGEQYEVVYSLADFNWYGDLNALEKDSDLVVTGRFTEDAAQEGNGYVNSFEIGQTLKGSSESDVIRIFQRYTVNEGSKSIVAYSHLTPMAKDSEWICFLKSSGSEDMYYCTGDTSGRYPFPFVDMDREKLENNEYSADELGVYRAEDFRYDIYSELPERYDIVYP